MVQQPIHDLLVSLKQRNKLVQKRSTYATVGTTESNCRLIYYYYHDL